MKKKNNNNNKGSRIVLKMRRCEREERGERRDRDANRKETGVENAGKLIAQTDL